MGIRQRLDDINSRISLNQETALDNHDLRPIPKGKRTWKSRDWISMWVSDQYAPATWELGSSLAGLGLPARVAIPLSFFGFLIIGVVMWLAGNIGATYHIPFPVINRSAWGIRGSYFPVFARAFLALMWLTILTYNGGNVVEQMLIALSPRFANMSNAFPESANITSRGLLCFFIYWAIQTPISMIPIGKLKYFFAFKALVCPPAFIAIGIWALVATKGGGPLVRGTLADVEGNKAWACIQGLNIVTTIYCTVSVNISDFTRYSSNAKNTWQQILLVPLTGTIPVACGYFAADACNQLYGVEAWDPATLIRQWGSRPCVFLGGLAFLISTIGVNISANSVSFATDFMSLFPRYLDLKRGALLAALLAVAMTPWNIVNDATAFVNFLGAYGCWLGPISGVMLTDYYLLRRQRLDIRELYKHPEGIYSYTYGLNLRAYLAFLVAFVPNVPGFVNAINPKAISHDTPTYRFNWYFGFSVASMVYYLTCRFILPLPANSLIDEAVYPDDLDASPDGFEQGKECSHNGPSMEESNVGRYRAKVKRLFLSTPKAEVDRDEDDGVYSDQSSGSATPDLKLHSHGSQVITNIDLADKKGFR
ncbi:hypothetical protein IE53DRAFT_110835 [Violaceomyces palustris]|uniref:Uncharacterized protein n=1 Tax=Violaceomyces palustris TaxID=1673888 RepID=A0ACD0NWI1_9BASI|nr:hypothetical protein IE53DRAFT_110835 [Violaceomyces palustris]